ncbi:MAG: AlpA family transcriptional regulator [Gammaproteobacteria bacterium]
MFLTSPTHWQPDRSRFPESRAAICNMRMWSNSTLSLSDGGLRTAPPLPEMSRGEWLGILEGGVARMSFLRLRQVVSVTGLSRMTIWRLERAGGFPQPRQLGARSVAWLQSEVEQWIESRPATGGAGCQSATRASRRSA